MWRHTPILLILILLTIGVYAEVRHYGFIAYDDDGYVRDNQYVQQGLTVENLWWALTSRTETNWHPVTWLSHMLDCQLFGPDQPGWYHLVNLVLHVANSVLVYVVFHRMTRCIWRPAFVAALFAIHPLHVESVAWIAERKDVLSTLFWLLSIICYVHYTRHASRFAYILAILCLAIGLASKPMLVTAPFLFLLLDYWPLGRILPVNRSAQKPDDKVPAGRRRPHKRRDVKQASRSQHSDRSQHHAPVVKPTNQATNFACASSWTQLLVEKLPMFALVFASSAMTFYAQSAGGAVSPTPLSHRLANAVVAYIRYLGKTVWPQNLAVLYPNLPGMWNFWQVIGALALLVAVSALVFVSWRRRYLTVGWCWYLGTLVPVIGLIQVGQQSMADRYMYLPLTGLAIMLTWGMTDVVQHQPTARRLVVTAAVTIVVGCGWLTYQQVRLWRSSEALFKHTLAVTRSNYVIHNNLGVVLQDMGRSEEAITQYQFAIGANANYADAHYNLARARQDRQEYDVAIHSYLKALQLRPDDPNTHNNLAGAYHLSQQLDKAIEHYRMAVDLNPQHVESWYNLAGAMRDKKDWQSSIGLYRHVVQLKPDHAAAHNNLGVLLHMQGELEPAIQHYRQALALDGDNFETHLNLAVALEARGRFTEALQHVESVLRIVPRHDRARKMQQRLKHAGSGVR